MTEREREREQESKSECWRSRTGRSVSRFSSPKTRICHRKGKSEREREEIRGVRWFSDDITEKYDTKIE